MLFMFLRNHKIKKRLYNFEDSFLDIIEKLELAIDGKFHHQNLSNLPHKSLLNEKDLYPLDNVAVEWWYFSGHLNENYGYEFCIFKIASGAVRLGIVPFSLFRKKPFLVGHIAITDKNGKKFHWDQKTGLRSKQRIGDKLNLSVDNLNLELKGKKFIISGKSKIGAINLELEPQKKLVKHFQDGFNEYVKDQRTYYLSFTRMKTKGNITLNGKKVLVNGTSWFDHQKMNRPKKIKVDGWDWFSLMFDDGSELMLYCIKGRHTKGYKGGSFIDSKSKITNLKPDDFKIKSLKEWRSKKTGIVYPNTWEINLPKQNLKLKVKPDVDGQELYDFFTTPVAYWEGACSVSGKKNGKSIKGKSYVELVGYDKRFFSKFIQRSL